MTLHPLLQKDQTFNTNLPLQQHLEQFMTQFIAQVPTESVDKWQKAVTDLVLLGIAEQSLKEGEQVSDFILPNVRGEQVQLADLLARGPVVITFYRGVWCPLCNLELRALQAALPEITALGASLVAISPQTPDNSLTMVEKNELSFEVLTDEGNQVARQYGLVFVLDKTFQSLYKSWGIDLPAYNGDESWELPIPGTFIIAQDGTVRLAFVDPDYTHRLEPAEIIAALRTLVV